MWAQAARRDDDTLTPGGPLDALAPLVLSLVQDSAPRVPWWALPPLLRACASSGQQPPQPWLTALYEGVQAESVEMRTVCACVEALSALKLEPPPGVAAALLLQVCPGLPRLRSALHSSMSSAR